jgi:class 3 adenylate cyclase
VRARTSNNPLWTKWLDDVARRLDPDCMAEHVARRFSGSPRGEMEQTHREDVTIVFADLAGFTQRSVALEPEAVMSTVRGLFELAMPVMLAHRVTPITYMGDGLLAMTRADDHERRGLEFALALLRRAGYVSRLRAALGDAWPLHLRAGVASGPVVLGSIGSALKLDFAAIGLTTNLAARLQASASPQEVVCSEPTARRAGVDGPFEELVLKGFDKVGPVRACRVRPDAARPSDGRG